MITGGYILRIEQLTLIVAIAELGSISETAEKLHISQPAISIALDNLEKELNLRIFIRNRSGTKPTDNGKILIEKARQALMTVQEIKNYGLIDNRDLVGKIAISSNTSMCRILLLKSVIKFKKIYKKVDISLSEEGSITTKEDLLKNKVHIGLVSRRKYSDYDNTLTFIPLIKGKLLACVSKKSPLAGRETVSFKEIVAYPLILFSQFHRMNSHINDNIAKYGIPNILFTAKSLETVKPAIVEGEAITFFTDIALIDDPSVKNGDIMPIQIAEETCTEFGILYKKGNSSLLISRFIEHLVSEAKLFKYKHNINDGINL